MYTQTRNWIVRRTTANYYVLETPLKDRRVGVIYLPRNIAQDLLVGTMITMITGNRTIKICPCCGKEEA